MAARRTLLVLIALLVGAGLLSLLLRLLLPGGWTPARLLMLAGFLGTAPWTALCAANGLIGFVIRMGARDPVGMTFPVLPHRVAPPPPTAIALTLRDERIGPALERARRLLDGLDAAGAERAFTLFVLSDSGPDIGRAEEEAVAAFRAADRDPARIRYRRRAQNTGLKAGNIMDFLDNHAAGQDLMVTLDADSEMNAAAVLHLVRAMQADPSLGIVQHLTVGLPAAAGFARLFQFGMRAGMRVWATGQAWWQGDAGPYWGHNAVVRIAPFRAHARLPPLPGGQPILSHDQIEAVLLRAAGWGVRVLPQEDGSAEANPPCLPDFLARDLRWLSGNLQYRHLLGRPGLHAMGRWQLLQAILLFTGAPFYLLFLLAAAWAAATDAGSGFRAGAALALGLAWPAALHTPRLLGYLEIAVSAPERARYGGLARFAAGAVAEWVFTLLLDPIVTVARTGGILRLLCGARPGWPAQNRDARAVGWGEAVRLLWPQTVLGLLVFAGFAASGWRTAAWAIPFAGGLVVSVPFCVLTAAPAFGRWLRRRGVAAVPEELPAGSGTHAARSTMPVRATG